jgi:uncharacterized protein involved in tellurium resistance
LAHVFEHDTVVGCVECAFVVRILDVDVSIVDLSAFHQHDDGSKGVVYAAE